MTLLEMLESGSKKYPKKTALVFKEKRISYQDLNEYIDRMTEILIKKGLKKNENVGLLLKNSPEFIIFYFAILKVGAVVVPINTMFKTEEISHILKDSQSAILITSSLFASVISPLKWRLERLRSILIVEDFFPDILSSHVSPTFEDFLIADSRPEDVCVILYTSGTTGHPKGAMLTHHNLISNVRACLKAIKVTEDDNFICVLPMFHSFAWTVCVLLPLYAGSSITILESVRPFSQLIRNVIRNRVSIFVGVPSMYGVFVTMHMPALERWYKTKDRYPMRLCISGAAALPAEILKKFEEKFHIRLLEGYGLTEASPVVSLNPLEGISKPGSIGLPLEDIQVKIVDDDSKELPTQATGELLVKGPNVMKGYLNLPQDTSQTIKDGWLYTGDLAKIDEDGYIYIVDRKKDMINVRGFNVYPREIEDLLYHNPKIAEAAVVGIADIHHGEIPKAFVVLKKGEVAAEHEIISFLRQHLANYKVPRTVEFKETLPKTTTGKILKRALK